jgi:autotransporter passenger strand-loop-strand repeat protein
MAAPDMTVFVVASGQTSTGLLIQSGDLLFVRSGGTASATLVLAGGNETVSGTDIGGTIDGGLETVASGGTTINETVAAGGFVTVASGGKTSRTTVDAGSIEIVDAGGVTISTVLSGGTELVESGSFASLTVIKAERLCSLAARRAAQR